MGLVGRPPGPDLPAGHVPPGCLPGHDPPGVRQRGHVLRSRSNLAISLSSLATIACSSSSTRRPT